MFFWPDDNNDCPAREEDEKDRIMMSDEEEDSGALDGKEDASGPKAAEGPEPDRDRGITWDDAEQLSAAVLESIPRTATARLATGLVVLSYFVYMHTRLEACASAAS